MQITFYNECKYIVHLSIESQDIIQIQPHGMVVVNCEKNDSVICINRNILSFKEKNKYILVLATKYKVTNIQDNDIFRITHEKVHIGLNVYYDKLFLNSETTRCTMEGNNVLGEDEIKKKFHKSRIKSRLSASFFEAPASTIFFIILGIILGCEFGWNLAVIYFPAVCLWLIAFDVVIEKIIQLIFHKAFNMEDEKTEFYKFCKNEFITKYYSDSERTPFMEKIEKDRNVLGKIRRHK